MIKHAQDETETGFDFVTIEQLRANPLFENLPYKFLEYHARTVVRRKYNAGDVVCEEGEYGATAFLIIQGVFEIIPGPPRESPEEPASVEEDDPETEPEAPREILPTWLRSGFDEDRPMEDDLFPPIYAPPAPPPEKPGDKAITRSPADVILGEMSCLSHHPRTATIIAWSDRCEMWEIRRNFLDALLRNRNSRSRLEEIYRERAIPDLLRNAKLFAKLPAKERESIVAYLQKQVEFVRVDPGQTIFEQGQDADHFYFVRLGFVKIARKVGAGEFVLDYLGPNTQFGEIGLLTSASVDYMPESRFANQLPDGFARGKRSATVTALEDVELVRIKGEDFHKIARRSAEFRRQVVLQAKKYLRKNQEMVRHMNADSLSVATEWGLHHANQLLVLDLNKCTRCDECTRACSDTHGGISRLKRDGMRYGDFLVATSCRSCQNPYCMAGCPVDAIHRKPPSDQRKGLEIVIEDWCIGCGRCERNCPYGNISMTDYYEEEAPKTYAPREKTGPAAATASPSGPKGMAWVRWRFRTLLGRVHPRFAIKHRPKVKAVTCDLCREHNHSPDEEVACVYACPHDAAHRMSGQKLIELVRQASEF